MENQGQHTPGEWTVSYSDDEDNERYVISNEGVLIADCYADTPLDLGLPGKEEFRKNARLIAAAPELLEAAADLLSAKDRTNQSLRDALRRAVLKAGGKIYSKS